KIQVTEGTTVALKPAKTHGAPTAINLDTLLSEKPAERAKWLSANSDLKLNPKAAEDLKQAASVDDLLVALDNRIARNATPHPVPVDLAKLSLWLATLAREHPFTFLDHNLKCGDSLVGLTRRQLGDFHWRDEPRRVLGQDQLEKRIQLATARRKEILEADDELV